MKPPHTNVAFDVHFYSRKHGYSMASNDNIRLKVHYISRTAEVDMHYAALDKFNYAKINPYFRQCTFHIMNPKTSTTHMIKKNTPPTWLRSLPHHLRQANDKYDIQHNQYCIQLFPLQHISQHLRIHCSIFFLDEVVIGSFSAHQISNLS